ncbi:pseudouridine synthase [Rhodoferax sp. GW822-FHT02A01]|uniref:pseudouridine synthase n=1 Tax=Rhodoferax sp. GW822-FHT02A01 TaxID=3141537 RepID=UPI00315D1FBE
MARYRPNPPPPRDGLSPSCVVVPDGVRANALEFFAARFTAVVREDWQQRLNAGDIVDSQGLVLRADTPVHTGQRIYYYRSLPTEPKVPFEERIVWQDEHIVVADKPHFLPVIPSGKYVRETLLVRLNKAFGTDSLAPAHRIDRDTAGLVLFTRNPATRNLYHRLFREHQVRKTYHAVARWNPALAWPVTRHTRIAEGSHFMQQAEVPGPANALTHIRPIQQTGEYALYELQPVTGQRHQLRVHMHALGLPLVHDGIYPTLTPEGSADTSKPLQLLAKTLAFTDPVTGEPRHFTSGLSLLPLQDVAADHPVPISD